MTTTPTLLWLRRDLRLGDHPALDAARARGGPVIPLFILDDAADLEGGAAARWRLSRSLEALARALEGIGGRLILRRGPSASVLDQVIGETGAGTVIWSRRYEPEARARDAEIKADLRGRGLDADSRAGMLLREPHEVRAKTGGFYKVYTPYSRASMAMADPGEPLPAPERWPAPARWPRSETLAALGLETGAARGAAVLAERVAAGEAAAEDKLARFLDGPLARYATDRDRLDRDGCSSLSDHLALGEISPRRVWAAAGAAVARDPAAATGAEVFLKEILWRDFAWHLAYHTPRLLTDNWRAEWDAFPWREDGPEARAAAEAWTRGRTGVDVVDAAMRELYVTGRMHNRARMLTASYLTKHLLVHWRVGAAWFRDCLIDWDAASNAMGWQWAAGSGPDAAPFFRVFNPETQAAKFDPDGAYVARWLPEAGGRGDLLSTGAAAARDGMRFFDACPRRWGLSPTDPRPAPKISLSEGRQRALAAYDQTMKTKSSAE